MGKIENWFENILWPIIQLVLLGGKLRQIKTVLIKCLTQMHFFSLLRGAKWYYNAIYILIKYFASFIGYEDDICEVIFNLHMQGANFGGKKRRRKKFGGKSFVKLNSVEFMEFLFSKSVLNMA